LSTIKLTGFKSFVDPTVLHLPGNLVGIVGPNGCGKSNIIDAVRWVMGESSARSLRGETMSDVIFNGSASRKPVGQASIELVFDNSAGRLGGPWASYAEIAIRRLLGRDGQSSYFLNGTRCRRRDIADIFLGTGLGPRSYGHYRTGHDFAGSRGSAEDLRAFLEEAAGISHYKERRRETETRIRHARENLARLDDVRGELGRQLQHLQRQARAAEQYREYRAEERRLRAELLALRWRELQTDLTEREPALRRLETALEALLAEQRRLEAELEAGRTRRAELNQAFNDTQGRYYQAGAEISRLEQLLHHQRELRRRREEDWRQAAAALEQVETQAARDRQQRAEFAAELAAAELDLARVLTEESDAAAELAAPSRRCARGRRPGKRSASAMAKPSDRPRWNVPGSSIWSGNCCKPGAGWSGCGPNGSNWPVPISNGNWSTCARPKTPSPRACGARRTNWPGLKWRRMRPGRHGGRPISCCKPPGSGRRPEVAGWRRCTPCRKQRWGAAKPE